MSKNNFKTVRADNLQDGTEFWIPGMEDQTRDLRVKYVTSAGVCVLGSQLVNGHWKPLDNYISGTTPVVVGSCPTEIIEDKPTKPQKSEKKIMNEENTQVTTETTTQIKGKRGRAKKHTISLPVDTDFTVDALAIDLAVPRHAIVNEMTRQKNRITKVGTVDKAPGKGRAKTVYKFI